MRSDAVRRSDRTYTAKAGLLPAEARTGSGDNDTSVIRGPAAEKAGRQKTYGSGKQPDA